MPNCARQIVIWKLSLPQHYPDEAYYYALLGDAEKKRAGAFVTKDLATRYVLAQGVLRTILGNYLGIAPTDIEFTLGPYKKPFLSNDPSRLQFSLAHSQDLALIGISFEDEVGVDVEMCNPKILDDHLERIIFSENELKTFSETPATLRLEAFFSAWTHKEALLKLAGVGFYKEPKEVEVPLRVLQHTSPILYEGKTRYLKSFFLHEGYIGAVASTKVNFEVLLKDYEATPMT